MTAVPPSIRWILLLAFVLGCVVVVWFPQPPPHPRTIVADMGLSSWWWGREPSEDPPLYRTIEPEPAMGIQQWQATEKSRVRVFLWTRSSLGVLATFDAPVSGTLQLDTQNMNGATGLLSARLDAFHSGDRRFDKAVAEFAGMLSERNWEGVNARPERIDLGTAPRRTGESVLGEITLRLDVSGHPVSLLGGFRVVRAERDRLLIVADERLLVSLDALFPGLEMGRRLAEIMEAPHLRDEVEFQFDLELVRVLGDSSQSKSVRPLDQQ